MGSRNKVRLIAVPAALVLPLALLPLQAQVVIDGSLSAQGTTVKSLNNVQFADQFSGADACAKINAAWSALPLVYGDYAQAFCPGKRRGV
jgi:hypothetical protein